MKKIVTMMLTAALLTSAVLTGCAKKESQQDTSKGSSAASNTEMSSANQEKKFNIVTTIFPEYDWVREIVGEKADRFNITYLLDKGVDLHSYQPTAEDIAKITAGDLFVHVGGVSDGWVKDAVKESGNSGLQVVNLLETLGESVKEEVELEGMEKHSHDHDHGHDHDDGDHDHDHDDHDHDDHDHDHDDHDHKKENVKQKPEKKEEGAAIKKDSSEKKNKKKESTTDSKKKMEKKEAPKKEDHDDHDHDDHDDHDHDDHDHDDHDHDHDHDDHDHDHKRKEGAHFERRAASFAAAVTAPGEPDDDHGHKHHHDGPEYDEHVWLSLKHAETLVQKISEKIRLMDPEFKDVYAKNTEAYLAKLKALDAQFEETVKKSKNKTILFGDRFPFRYMVDDYGLTPYAAFLGCSAETEASFETVAFLAKKTDDLGLSAVCVIENSNQKLAKTIIENTKNKNQNIIVMNSMQSVTEEEVQKGLSYLSVMEENLNALQNALK